MMKLCTLVLLCYTNIYCVYAHSPRIIIVGAGAAGIGAATRLLQHGFTNITILEAENRIGGRIHSIKLGEYMVDLGGQWVHGEKGNVVYELAWPLGLLEPSTKGLNFTTTIKLFSSAGSQISHNLTLGLMNFFHAISVVPITERRRDRSYGDYAELKFDEYFKANPAISADLRKPLLHFFNLMQVAMLSANSWYDVAVKDELEHLPTEGDGALNWKERTYSTIFDILMKKYPNRDEELPVINNTIFNSKVTHINYNETSGSTKVLTRDGRVYITDHVIVTTSLGVLKANYEKLFDPPLPNNKINSIKNIGYGHVAKIFLYYNDPWWPSDDDIYMKGIYWTNADTKNIENDPKRKWMLGVTSFFRIAHRPKILCIWVTSNLASDMELVPEELFYTQIAELLNRFFGRTYNVTRPTQIARSTWNTNDNFKGTFSFRNLQSDPTRASPEALAEPIMRHDKPILQFAGEATAGHWATVHGAITSGWREADRLFNFYLTNHTQQL